MYLPAVTKVSGIDEEVRRRLPVSFSQGEGLLAINPFEGGVGMDLLRKRRERAPLAPRRGVLVRRSVDD
jgi:hypothetical protein